MEDEDSLKEYVEEVQDLLRLKGIDAADGCFQDLLLQQLVIENQAVHESAAQVLRSFVCR